MLLIIAICAVLLAISAATLATVSILFYLRFRGVNLHAMQLDILGLWHKQSDDNGPLGV